MRTELYFYFDLQATDKELKVNLSQRTAWKILNLLLFPWPPIFKFYPSASEHVT